MRPGWKQVAVLGGSFDPPHVGHVMLATFALSAGGVDGVLVVPTFGHAFGKKSAPFEDRVRMAELAFACLDPARVAVSRIEERLPTPSFTVQTLEALVAAHPGVALRWLCGADVLAALDRWREPERVIALAPLLAVGRSGHARSALGRTVTTAGPDLPDVSSTDIRARLAAGDSAEGLVPSDVLTYAAEHGLYR